MPSPRVQYLEEQRSNRPYEASFRNMQTLSNTTELPEHRRFVKEVFILSWFHLPEKQNSYQNIRDEVRPGQKLLSHVIS